MPLTGNDIYGAPIVATPAPVAQRNGSAPTEGSDQRDPHDKNDPGPANLLEDPTFWVVAVAAVATGLIGFRFNWSRSGAQASVDLGDELAFWAAVPLASIAGILIFKTVASKVEIRGLQAVAAAI